MYRDRNAKLLSKLGPDNLSELVSLYHSFHTTRSRADQITIYGQIAGSRRQSSPPPFPPPLPPLPISSKGQVSARKVKLRPRVSFPRSSPTSLQTAKTSILNRPRPVPRRKNASRTPLWEDSEEEEEEEEWLDEAGEVPIVSVSHATLGSLLLLVLTKAFSSRYRSNHAQALDSRSPLSLNVSLSFAPMHLLSRLSIAQPIQAHLLPNLLSTSTSPCLLLVLSILRTNRSIVEETFHTLLTLINTFHQLLQLDPVKVEVALLETQSTSLVLLRSCQSSIRLLLITHSTRYRGDS